MTTKGHTKRNQEIRHTPVDFAMLARLPKAGSMVGLRYVAKTISGVTTELRAIDPSITSSLINSRMRRTHQLNLVERVALTPSSAGWGWQINDRGLQLLKRHGVAYMNATKEEEGGSSG